MVLDVKPIRAHFPALQDGAAHFDGPGGSQTPDVVADAIRSAMLRPLANRGFTTRAERNAEEIVGQCRHAVADLLNADPDGVIFGRSMTALTFDNGRAGRGQRGGTAHRTHAAGRSYRSFQPDWHDARHARHRGTHP